MHDHLGSVRSVILDDKSIIGQYDYEPFGGLGSGAGGQSRLKYINKETDAESSDHNHGVRQYTDNIGRFVCPDPLWEKYAGWTPYQYCRNNPMVLKDDNGKEFGYDMTPYHFQEAAKNYVDISIQYFIDNGANDAASTLTYMRDSKDFKVQLDAWPKSLGAVGGVFNGSYTYPQIRWSPFTALAAYSFDGNTITFTPAEVLLHECHEFLYQLKLGVPYDKESPFNPDYDNVRDEYIITGPECETREILHPDKDKGPRNSHSNGFHIIVDVYCFNGKRTKEVLN